MYKFLMWFIYLLILYRLDLVEVAIIMKSWFFGLHFFFFLLICKIIFNIFKYEDVRMMITVILSSLQNLIRLKMHPISEKLEVPFHLCHMASQSFPGKSGRLVLLSTLRSCIWGDVCRCRHPVDLLWSRLHLLSYQTSEKPDRSSVCVRSTWEAEAKKQKQVASK